MASLWYFPLGLDKKNTLSFLLEIFMVFLLLAGIHKCIISEACNGSWMTTIPKIKVRSESGTFKEGGLRLKGVLRKSSPEKPLVSVITVVLNGERHLEETIRSIVSQSYDNIEYIILDGGSHDRTLEIIRSHDADIDYWISTQDAGIYDAMNKGIQLSRGELINLLNADDYLDSCAINTIVAKYLDKKRPGIVYGDYYLIDEVLGYKTEIKSNLDFWLGMTVSHQAMFVQKGVYASLGSYNTEYQLASDYDFLLRAIKNGVEFVHTGDTIVNRRLHGRGGKNYILSKRETCLINRAYFKNDYVHRMLFYANAVLDTVKLGILRGLQIMLGAGSVKYLLMKYYKTRSIRCYSITG